MDSGSKRLVGNPQNKANAEVRLVVGHQEDRLRFLVEKVEKLRYDFLLIFESNMGLIDVILGDLSKLGMKKYVRH